MPDNDVAEFTEKDFAPKEEFSEEDFKPSLAGMGLLFGKVPEVPKEELPKFEEPYRGPSIETYHPPLTERMMNMLPEALRPKPFQFPYEREEEGPPENVAEAAARAGRNVLAGAIHPDSMALILATGGAGEIPVAGKALARGGAALFGGQAFQAMEQKGEEVFSPADLTVPQRLQAGLEAAGQIPIAAGGTAHAILPRGLYARSIETPAAVHGDLRTQPGEGPRPVPAQEGGPGVQPQAEGGMAEAAQVSLRQVLTKENAGEPLTPGERQIKFDHSRNYYARLLANPELIQQGVRIGDDLAVPLGGSRKAGSLSQAFSKSEAENIAAQLKKANPTGFRNAEAEPVYDEAGELDGYLVRWGEDWRRFQGNLNKIGRLYGYKESELFASPEEEPAGPMEMEATPEEEHERLLRQGMVESALSKGQVQVENPHLVSEADHATLLAGAEENARTGLPSRVRMVDKSEGTKAYGVAFPDRETGEIIINRDVLENETRGLSAEEKNQYVRRVIAEEGLHLITDPNDAGTHWANMGQIRQTIFERQYWGERGMPQRFAEMKQNSPIRYARYMGHESLRADLQRALRGKPTELFANVRGEKWVQRALDIMTRVIQGWERLTRREGSKVQRDLVQKYIDKINEVREANNLPKMEAGPEGEEPFQPPRRKEELPIPAGETGVDEVEKMSDAEAVKFFNSMRDQGNSPQYDSPLAGMKMSIADLPRLEKLRDESGEAMKGAIRSGDQNKMLANFGKNVWYSGAIEGVKREGPNYRAAIAKKEATPMAPKRRRPGPGEEPELIPGGIPLEQQLRDARRSLEFATAQREEKPEQYERVKARVDELERQTAATKPERGAPGYQIPPEQAETLAQEAYPEIPQGYTDPTTGRHVPGELENKAVEQMKSDRPEFAELLKDLQKRFGKRIKPGAVRDVWQGKVWDYLAKASGAELTRLRKALGLVPRMKIMVGGRPATMPEAEWQELVRKYHEPGEAAKIAKQRMRTTAGVLKEIVDPLESLPLKPYQDPSVVGVTATERAEQAADFRRKAARAQQFLDSAPNASAHTKFVLNRLIKANLARASIVEKGGSLARGERPRPIRPTLEMLMPRAGESTTEAIARARQEAMSAHERQRREQLYRLREITRIAEKLIAEAAEDKTVWYRKEIDNTDLDYSGKSKQPTFNEIGPELMDRPGVLGDILTEDSGTNRTGKNAPPVSVTRRVTAMIHPKTGRVDLVSTYKDGRRGAVLLDPFAPGVGEHSTLASIIGHGWRPFASLLLDEPVKNFHMKFENMADFNDHIGTEARKATEGRAGYDLEDLVRSAQMEREDLGPEAYEGEMQEGLPSTGVERGEGGMFMGPEAGGVRTEVGVGVGRTALDIARDIRAPLEERQINAIVDDWMDEGGQIGKPDSLPKWWEGIEEAARADDMTPRQRDALHAYIKSVEYTMDMNPDWTAKQAGERVLDWYYDIIKNAKNREGIIQAAMGRFSPEALQARQAALQAAAGAEAVRRTRPTIRPETRPAFAGEPALTPPGVLPEEQPAGLPIQRVDIPAKQVYQAGERRVTSIQPPPEHPVPEELPVGMEYSTGRPIEMRQREFPFAAARRRAEEGYSRVKGVLGAAIARHATTERIYATRDGLEGEGKNIGRTAGNNVRAISQEKGDAVRAEKHRTAVQAVIATGEVTIRKQKGQKLPPMRQVEDALKYADVLLNKPDALSKRVGKTLRSVANKLRAAGNEIFSPQDVAMAEKLFRERIVWRPDRAKIPGLIEKAENGYNYGAALAAKKNPGDRIIGRRWMKAAKELADAAAWAQEHWNDRDFQKTVDATRTEITDHFQFQRENGVKLAYKFNYFPGRYEADLFNDNTVSFGELRVLGRNFRKPKIFPNYYDAIEKGPYIPVTLDAADLVEHRITQGMTEINKPMLMEAFKKVEDPDSGEPVVMEPRISEGVMKEPSPDYQLWSYGTNKKVYAIRTGYLDAFKKAFLESGIRQSPTGRAMLWATQRLKHDALLIWDTFHPGRLRFYQTALTGNPFAYKGGLAALEYREADLPKAVKAGLITQAQADWATAIEKVKAGDQVIELSRRQILEEMIRRGFLVARHADALFAGLHSIIPGVTRMQKWVFDRQTRGLMAEAAVRNFIKINNANPNLGLDKVINDVIKDTNIFYGQMGRQGVIKNPTYRDLAQLFTLAPSWVEGLVQKEARFAGRMTGLSYLTGRRGVPQMGMLGKGMAKGLASFFALTQALNLITRRQFTFQNKEKGHQMDAWIPTGKGEGDGFWLSPLSVFGEITHDLLRLAQSKGNTFEAIRQIGYNKLGPLGRLGMILATRETPMGQRIPTTAGVAKEMAYSLAPVPITIAAPLKMAAHKLFPGQVGDVPRNRLFQQAVASLTGVKIHPGETATRQIQNLAKNYVTREKLKPESFVLVPTTEPGPSRFFDAVDLGDDIGAKHILKRLEEKDPGVVAKIIDQAANQAERPFTGSEDHEPLFMMSLTPEQLQMYWEANMERMTRYQKILEFLGKP